MKRFLALFGAAALGALLYVSSASAHEDFKNLKVLNGADKKALEKGMKTMTKGLGVKCDACHVKGEFDSDKVEAKLVARNFFTATVGEKDQAKRDAALAEVLKALKVEKAKDPKAVWAGVDTFKKK